MWAIAWIDDLSALPPDTLAEIRSICLARVQKDGVAERNRTLTCGADRPLDSLVTLALADDNDAAWDAVQAVIADSEMPAWYKQGAIARMATAHEHIPKSHRAALAAAVRAANNAPPSRWHKRDFDLTGEIGYAQAVIDGNPDDNRDAIARLAGGSEHHRCWAGHLADETGDVTPL